MTYASFLDKLKSQKHRITPVRRAIVDYFTLCPCAIDFSDIQNYLTSQNLSPNKTTLYRELEFLQSEGFIEEINFGEGKKRYELAQHHHHHLICTECHDIQGVEVPNDLHEQESRIFSDKQFKVTRHMLEFFGICRQCQRKETAS